MAGCLEAVHETSRAFIGIYDMQCIAAALREDLGTVSTRVTDNVFVSCMHCVWPDKVAIAQVPR